jgi:hypothetical protein
MLNVGLRVVKMGKSSLMYEVGVFQEGSDQVKVSTQNSRSVDEALVLGQNMVMREDG